MTTTVTRNQQMSVFGRNDLEVTSPIALRRTATVDDWMIENGLNFSYESSPIIYQTPQGQRTYPQTQVLYRSDTHAPIGHMSQRFKPVQPREMVQLYHDICGRGDYTLEALGALKGGAKIWGLARTRLTTRLFGQDRVDGYLLFVSGNDTNVSTRIQFLSRRLVCSNQIDAAIREGGMGNWRLKIRHVSKPDWKDIAAQLIALPELWHEFEDAAERMARQRIDQEALVRYFVGLFAQKSKSDEPAVQKKVRELLHLYRSAPGQNLRSADGTVWGALNAVTYYTDHACRARSKESRFESSILGQGEKLKELAWQAACELADIA